LARPSLTIDLLHDFLDGGPHARATLLRRLHPRLLGPARTLAPDLAQRDLSGPAAPYMTGHYYVDIGTGGM
jgi:hypothetical protein